MATPGRGIRVLPIRHSRHSRLPSATTIQGSTFGPVKIVSHRALRRNPLGPDDGVNCSRASIGGEQARHDGLPMVHAAPADDKRSRS